jgi:hypothetical protein
MNGVTHVMQNILQHFKNWTSGNVVIDKLIQETQLSANFYEQAKWIDRYIEKWVIKIKIGK